MHSFMNSETMKIFIALFGFGSAACWIFSATANAKEEDVVARKKRKAEKEGTKPDLSAVILGGYDVQETLKMQTRWNAAAAILAAITVILQSARDLVG